MRLTVVGCAGSYPNATSPASCYLLEHDGATLVLDLGSGSLGALHNYIDPSDPDSILAVALSHCHIDHCADLASLYVARRHHPTNRFVPIPVLGPSDTSARLVAIYGMRSLDMVAQAFDVRTHLAGPVELGPFTVETVPAVHPVESYCIRVNAGGRSLTYSGDTGPTTHLVDLASDTDVALFEASFVGTANPPNLHLSGADAARAARDAGARRLILTHLVAYNDPEQVRAEASEVYNGPIELATAGMTVEV